MFKSVFSKYFAILAVLLLSAMTALGLVQMIYFKDYWIDDRRERLTENTAQIAAHATRVIVQAPDDPNAYILSENSIQPMVELLASVSDMHVVITDTAGHVVIRSSTLTLAEEALPQTALTEIEEGYFAVGTMNGMFSSVQYTAATPIYSPDGKPIGYVITASSADDLLSYLSETMKTYFMSAIIVLLVLFIVIYALSYRLVKPLRDMAAATRRFAEGDFSCRVSVKGKDEVAELAAALNNMAVSLSTTDNMSRSFVANVSHELKTPMTTISGFIDGILDGTIPPERQQHYLRIVSDEVKRLSRLVRSMLELSRIDNGTVAIKPVSFDLMQSACDALLSFEKRIEEKNVNITGLSECSRTMVTADYDLIGQVVYNLLDNAVKFVNDGGEIAVNIYREQGRVYCAVRNSGAGLAPEEMPRVFERFYKTDRSRSLDKTGVGLGLFIVKTVINLHHGEIYVRSVQGEYCEFVFWLPEDAADFSKKEELPAASGQHPE